MKTLVNSIWARFYGLIAPITVLLVTQADAGLPATPDPLPVFLRGAGNWLDRENAAQKLSLVLPDDGQALVTTNMWVQGHSVLTAQQESISGLLLLSNVWTYGSTTLPEESFWRNKGLTNAPLELNIPGGSGYYLLIANNRVLPYVGRKGTLAPAAIWIWPKLPVKLKGETQKEADISQCRLISFGGEHLNLSGWVEGFSVRQTWRLSGTGGVLRLQLDVSVDTD